MKKEELNKIINTMEHYNMVTRELKLLEMTLKKKGLRDKTIDRKINDNLTFFCYIKLMKDRKEEVRFDNINDILYKYICSGYFSDDNLENLGTVGYRRSIFYNIMEGFNFVYKDMIKGYVIKQLTEEQILVLEELSKNKWFRCNSTREKNNTNGSIQTQLMEDLGLKVYFNENNEPYVYSHETAELIGMRHKDMLKALRKLMDKHKNYQAAKNFASCQSLDISMVEDYYEVERKDRGRVKELTYRLSKDLIINYILGLTGDKYSTFRFEYQSAFNYIEEEFKLLLQEQSELKKSFVEMFETMRIENRDFLVKDKKK